MSNKKSEKIYPKVLLFGGLFVVLVVLVCLFVIYTQPKGGLFNGAAREEAQSADAAGQENEEVKLMDNSTYEGQVYNLYRAYETGLAEYQLATLAPPYLEYVKESIYDGDEDAMEAGLQEMLDQAVLNYEDSFGNGYSLYEQITNEVTLSEAEVDALNAEMKEGYGKDFNITEAKELTVVVNVAYGEEDSESGENTVNSASAGKMESVKIVGKLEDGGWYILKERRDSDENI